MEYSKQKTLNPFASSKWPNSCVASKMPSITIKITIVMKIFIGEPPVEEKKQSCESYGLPLLSQNKR